MKKLAILGSTGSIGKQTLEVVDSLPNSFEIKSLVSYSNGDLLNEQKKQYRPEFSGLIVKDGEQCLVDAVEGCDLAVIATSGITAIKAVMYCIDNGIDVALANKETLVCAGELIKKNLARSGSQLMHVDSEHSALWQCLRGSKRREIAKLILTASGGAFRDFDSEQLHSATFEQALNHPNWSMGNKITIDSATMFNKTLEVLEARWLYGVEVDKIEILVHRQSIVHSLVQFIDGSVLAQMATPDMKLPIQYALTYPDRVNSTVTPLDLSVASRLDFEKVDDSRFPCANIAYLPIMRIPLMPTVVNAANDVCVDAFSNNKYLLKLYTYIVSAPTILKSSLAAGVIVD